MIPYDPFALSRLILGTRLSALHRSVAYILLIAVLVGSAMGLFGKASWTFADIATLVAYTTLAYWTSGRVLSILRRLREAKKIAASPHRGDRLHIEWLCEQQLGPSSNYHGETLDGTHQIVLTIAPHYLGRGYQIVLIERDLHSVEGLSGEHLYSYAAHEYLINPAVCAITHSRTTEFRTDIQTPGHGFVLEEPSTTRDYLEGDDITRIRSAFARSYVTVIRHSTGTES